MKRSEFIQKALHHDLNTVFVNSEQVENALEVFKDIGNSIELEQINELLKIQGNDGNWNYDSYMLGMYNGMELIVAILENREPKYRQEPKEWARNRESGKPLSCGTEFRL